MPSTLVMRRRTTFIALVYATLCLAWGFASTDAAPSLIEVSTPGGNIVGTIEGNFAVFRGIPYSNSPARFEQSELIADWAPNVLNATQYGAQCPQSDSSFQLQDEQCLFLNIWVPLSSSNNSIQVGSHPVLVFIHGGAFITGTGNDLLFSGDFFANDTESPSVLVTMNYRLGALGFLALGPDFTGNFGILDQQTALKWVQRYIYYFGGIPEQVTLFGQSAGAISVTAQLVSPTSKGLYYRALVESNPTGICWRTSEESTGLAEQLAVRLGCIPLGNETKRILDCLLKKSWQDIIVASKFDINYKIPLQMKDTKDYLPWQPTLDPVVLPQQTLAALKSGSSQFPIYSNVKEVVWGTVLNETGSWSWGVIPSFPLTVWEYRDALRLGFGDHAEVIYSYYPVAKGNETNAVAVRDVLTLMSTDFIFYCPTRAAANYTSSNGIPTYEYFFAHSPMHDAENDVARCNNDLVCHASDLPFFFHTEDIIGDPFTSAEVDLSWRMFSSLVSLANGTASEGNGGWVPWIAETDQAQWFDLAGNPTTVSQFRKAACDLWDSLNYYYACP